MSAEQLAIKIEDFEEKASKKLGEKAVNFSFDDVLEKFLSDNED